MVCDTRPRIRNQTLTERKKEVKEAIDKLSQKLAAKQVVPKIGPQGAIAFQGWREEDRAAVSDACAYRLLMLTGSAVAKAELMRAQQIAGRPVNTQAMAAGVHSHDGGKTWHNGH